MTSVAGSELLGDQRLAAVVVASTRAAAGTRSDVTGPMLRDFLAELGFSVAGPTVVADGDPVGTAIAAAIAAGACLVVTTGGTGLAPTDLTPERTRPLLDREVPGIAEALRAAGAANGVATSVLSRGICGLAGSTLVINLAGSRGAVVDAIDVLRPVLAHAVDQARGGDH